MQHLRGTLNGNPILSGPKSCLEVALQSFDVGITDYESSRPKSEVASRGRNVPYV